MTVPKTCKEAAESFRRKETKYLTRADHDAADYWLGAATVMELMEDTPLTPKLIAAFKWDD